MVAITKKGDLLVVQSKRIIQISNQFGDFKDTWIISDSLQELQATRTAAT
jgi:hypothetical protein